MAIFKAKRDMDSNPSLARTTTARSDKKRGGDEKSTGKAKPGSKSNTGVKRVSRSKYRFSVS